MGGGGWSNGLSSSLDGVQAMEIVTTAMALVRFATWGTSFPQCSWRTLDTEISVTLMVLVVA